MRWIDDAAFVCATGWNQGPTTSVYVGGFRFYRPLLIGHVVEVEARLLHTGRTSMHISVHVRSGDPQERERNLTTHGLLVYVALATDTKAVPVRPWTPVSDEDKALDHHARHLVDLRATAESWSGGDYGLARGITRCAVAVDAAVYPAAASTR